MIESREGFGGNDDLVMIEGKRGKIFQTKPCEPARIVFGFKTNGLCDLQDVSSRQNAAGFRGDVFSWIATTFRKDSDKAKPRGLDAQAE